MIQIELIDKGFLDLFEKTSISFQFLSPLFKDKITETGYSYPIDIPLTATNKKVLGFLDIAENTAKFESASCKILYNGLTLLYGTFNISRIDSNKVSAFILNYEFNETLLDTKLREIDLGGDRIVIGTGTGQFASMSDHATDTVNNPNLYDYVFFPVYNAKFYDGKTDYFNGAPHTYSKVVNLWDFNAHKFWQNPSLLQIVNQTATGYDLPDSPPSASTFVPFPYLKYVLKQIAKHLGVKLIGNWQKINGIDKLVIYNTFSLDHIQEVNETLSGTNYTYYLNDSNSIINLKNHLPDITIAALLDGLKNLFNLSITLTRDSLRIETKNQVFIQEEIDYTERADISLSIEPPAILPSQGYKFVMGTDSDDIHQDAYRELVIDSKVLDDENGFLPSDEVGCIRFFPNSYNAYINGYGTITSIPAAPVFQTAKGENEIASIIGTVDTDKHISIDYALLVGSSVPIVPVMYPLGVIPIVEQIGNSIAYGITTDYSFRLLFFAGMQASSGGYGNYPVGTSNVYDQNGSMILPYSLKWRGGIWALYESWWQQWLSVLEAKIMTFNLKLELYEFLNLDLDKPIKINNRRYLIKELQIGINKNGLGIAKCKCVLINF